MVGVGKAESFSRRGSEGGVDITSTEIECFFFGVADEVSDTLREIDGDMARTIGTGGLENFPLDIAADSRFKNARLLCSHC